MTEKFDVETVKGFEDYLPPISLKREAIRKTAEKWFKLYGFSPIETPIIEFDELMRPKPSSQDTQAQESEDEAISDRFKLKDRGDRNLGLRYEFTFQLARILKQNPNLKLPFKRFQIGENFRDEPIRTGRTRQFTQCDIDIVGDPSVNADAECLSVVSDILKELKIKDFEIQINNRKLLSAIIESVEISQSKEVMRELDKLQKIGEDTVKANLKKYTSSNQIITLFKLLEKDLAFFKKNAFPGAEEIEELLEICAFYGIKPRLNPTMTRGFSYYTGNVFEFLTKKKTAVIGGGRYDKSVGRFLYKDIPAVGISFSLEALMGLFDEEISNLQTDPIPKALLISISQDKPTIKVAQVLRQNEVSCSVWLDKVGKALEYANSLKIPFVIFIGEEEIEKKKFKIKNMKSGEEKLLSEKQIIKLLR